MAASRPAAPPRHLAIDARCVLPGATGVGRYVAGLLAGLDALGDSAPRATALVLPAALLPGSPLGLLRRVAIEVVEADFRDHPGGDWWLRAHLPRIVSRLGADTLVSPFFLSPPGRFPFRRVAGLLDALVWEAPGSYPFGYRHYLRWSMRRSADGADALFALSRAARAAVRRHLPAAREIPFGVVPGGIDTAVFHARRKEAETAEVRRRWRIPPEARLIAMVGSPEPRKNHALAVRALRPHARNAVLCLAGPWPAGERRRLADLAGPLPLRFRAPEGAEGIAELLRAADLVLFPSTAEGFGLPVLEAMACGAPLLASDIPAVREAAGPQARLLPPGDETAWALAVGGALTEPSKWAGRAHAAERAARWTWRRAAEALLRVAAPARGREDG
ncbi:MAG: glycosyltransferase family 1 protein [Candidatus Sumerlaeia bacterium]|nr:glycosyltransferase family 1 protein [Candidatus Sumerlaeia bacterium]